MLVRRVNRGGQLDCVLEHSLELVTDAEQPILTAADFVGNQAFKGIDVATVANTDLGVYDEVYLFIWLCP